MGIQCQQFHKQLQNIVDVRFQNICLGAVHGLNAVALDQQAQSALGLPCGKVSDLGGILHGNAQTGHAGVHQHDVLPAAQQGDDALGLTVIRVLIPSLSRSVRLFWQKVLLTV